MLITSKTKPPKIQITNIATDVYARKVTVEFTFNLNIVEDTSTQPPTYSYYQFHSDITTDLAFRGLIPQILKSLYEKTDNVLIERIKIAEKSIPSEIDWE